MESIPGELVSIPARSTLDRRNDPGDNFDPVVKRS